MDDRRTDLSLFRDLQEGAALEGEPAPTLEEVTAMAALLREVERPAVPPDLVPGLVQALSTAGPLGEPAAHAGGIRPLLRLLWADARFMPLSFLVIEGVLLAGAFLINWVLARDLPYDAGVGRSADGFILMAPWMGLAAVLFALRPTERSVWGDLEALSPFPPAVRLLVRAAAGMLTAMAGMAVTWLVSPGPVSLSLAVLVLARTAPLLMAVGWAVAWAVTFGPRAAVAASLGLWGAVTVLGPQLGSWNLLAVPQGLDRAAPQWTALALAALLWLWAVWRSRVLNGAGAAQAGGR
ncbi:MAG TPA: hypothetical protein VIL07_10690 [Symbiobacteriaceae bacterium]